MKVKRLVRWVRPVYRLFLIIVGVDNSLFASPPFSRQSFHNRNPYPIRGAYYQIEVRLLPFIESALFEEIGTSCFYNPRAVYVYSRVCYMFLTPKESGWLRRVLFSLSEIQSPNIETYLMFQLDYPHQIDLLIWRTYWWIISRSESCKLGKRLSTLVQRTHWIFLTRDLGDRTKSSLGFGLVRVRGALAS